MFKYIGEDIQAPLELRLAFPKADSLDCDGTDWWECSIGVMVNAYVNNPIFSFYPNPANDFIVIASIAK